MSPMFLDLLLAALPFGLGLVATWRLIWPKWKILGKTLAYFTGVAALSAFIGHWSLAFALAHQGLGLVIHIWFCRLHGFTWYAVEDPDRYVQLSKEMVGYKDAAPSTKSRTVAGVEVPPGRTMQTEGDKPDIEWSSHD